MRWSYRPLSRRPKSYESDEWYEEDHRTIQVHEPVDEPIDTGLLNSAGVPLYRIRQRDPVGF